MPMAWLAAQWSLDFGMIAGRLTMRAQVQRDSASGTDGWGNPVAADFVDHGDPVACFIWSTAASKTQDGEKTAQIETFRGLFALGADLAAEDRLASVTDRQGTAIIAGPLLVMGPIERKHTHVEANMRRIG